MSVEKFIISKEDSGYTIIPNKVIQHLQSNLELLGLWISLCSLPPNWEFYKTKIMSDHKLGRDKLNRYLGILEKCNLISVRQVRNIDGTYGEGSLHIKSGKDFIPFTENQLPVTENQESVMPPFTENRYTGNQLLDTAIYKRNNKKEINKQNKHKSFCAKSSRKEQNAQKHPFAQSMDQMAVEKKHTEEHEKRKQAEMHTPTTNAVRTSTNTTYANMRDFTAERLEREARAAEAEKQSQSSRQSLIHDKDVIHDQTSTVYGNRNRGRDMQPVKADILLQRALG